MLAGVVLLPGEVRVMAHTPKDEIERLIERQHDEQSAGAVVLLPTPDPVIPIEAHYRSIGQRHIAAIRARWAARNRPPTALPVSGGVADD